MTIVWSSGLDFDIMFESTEPTTSFSIPLFTIPALPLLAGMGTLVMAMAYSGTPGNHYATTVTPTQLGSVDLVLLDYANREITHRFKPDVNIQLIVPPPLLTFDKSYSGGTISLSGVFTDSSERFVGTAVACISDSYTWTSFGNIRTLNQGSWATAGSDSGTLTIPHNPDEIFGIDEVFGIAEALSVDTSGSVAYENSPDWITVIQRFKPPLPYCDYNSDSHAITTTPQPFNPWLVGTLPSNVTSVVVIMFLGGSGIGAIPQLDATLNVLDAGSAVIATSSTFTLPAGGGLLGFNQVLNVPAGASGIRIDTTESFIPGGLVTMTITWQVVIYCNNDPPYSYSVGIGQYTAVPTLSIPYLFTHPSHPVLLSSFYAFYDTYGFNASPVVPLATGYSFAHILG